jgi:hypothetical protein
MLPAFVLWEVWGFGSSTTDLATSCAAASPLPFSASPTTPQPQCFNLQFRANSRNSRSRASIVFHSPNPIPHFGQISKYTNSPSVSAPNKKFGATLHVEQTNITAPLRAFIPDK